MSRAKKLKRTAIEKELARVSVLIEATNRETHHSTSQALCRASSALQGALDSFDSDELANREQERRIAEEKRLCDCDTGETHHSRECAWALHIERRMTLKWSGLCPAGKRGLDFHGQNCDVCNPEDMKG